MEEAGDHQQQQFSFDLPSPKSYYDNKDYYIKVSCSGHVSGLRPPSVPPDDESTLTMCSERQDRVQVNVVVAVMHHSPSDPTAPTTLGYVTMQDFSIPSLEIYRRDRIMKMLDLTCIPFSLDGRELKWGAEYLLGNNNYKLTSSTRYLKNTDDLITEFVKFSYSADGLTNVLLKIIKWVALPRDELEAWRSWHMENLLDAEKFLFVGPMRRMRRYMAVVKEVEELRMDRESLGEGVRCLCSCSTCSKSKEFARTIMEVEEGDDGLIRLQSSCSICLQEIVLDNSSSLSKGFVTWLPCCHVFHEACIIPWLWRKQSCPYCRATVRIPDYFHLDVRSRLSFPLDR